MNKLKSIISQAKSPPFRDRCLLRHLLGIAKWRLRGFSTYDYFVYPLYRAKDLVVPTKRYKALQAQWNPRTSGIVAFDKWIQASHFHAHGIPHPRAYCHISGSTLIRNSLPGPLNEETLRAVFTDIDLPAILKPVGYGMGRGIDLITEVSADGLVLATEGLLPVADFVQRLRDTGCAWLIQQRVSQHEDLAQFNPSSTNTVRVTTHRYPDGKVAPVFAGLRMGAAGSIVDNVSGGGLIAPVNLESGVLGAAQGAWGDERIEAHPNSGAQIAGRTIPFWREILDMAIRAHHLIPGPAHLAFDVAIETHGPCILEVNGFIPAAQGQRIDPEFFPRILNGNEAGQQKSTATP